MFVLLSFKKHMQKMIFMLILTNINIFWKNCKEQSLLTIQKIRIMILYIFREKLSIFSALRNVFFILGPSLAVYAQFITFILLSKSINKIIFVFLYFLKNNTRSLMQMTRSQLFNSLQSFLLALIICVEVFLSITSFFNNNGQYIFL